MRTRKLIANLMVGPRERGLYCLGGSLGNPLHGIEHCPLLTVNFVIDLVTCPSCKLAIAL